jgi:hypothetical protein
MVANMKKAISVTSSVLIVIGILSFTHIAVGSVSTGIGNAGLLGGDLTDPEDDVVDRNSYGGDLPEDKLRPLNGSWVKMTSAPNSPPGTPPHQRHSYQSWQNSPACAIFLNNPEKRKWYVGFKDGGFGGPTKKEPYYAAVQFAKPIFLTHFTFTTAPDMPNRDPKTWALQGSNTGKADDWTDIYRCDAQNRSGTALREKPRNETNLFTSFTSKELSTFSPNGTDRLADSDVKKITAKLNGRPIAKADFAPQSKAYTWLRIVVYSCFNPNSIKVPDPRYPAGFSIGQLELFGVAGAKRAARVDPDTTKTVKPPVYDPPFIISYWCGPPKSETTLARYKEIANCGFNVAFPPCSDVDEETNLKILDLCNKVGIKALVHARLPKSTESPEFERTLNAQIAKYSSHPALLGYHLLDEPHARLFPLLGAINEYLLKKDPKHLPYINILPNYASPAQLGNNTYVQHVDQYIKTVKPALCSWDHYKQMAGNENYYWRNLEIVRHYCLKSKTPLIQIINTLPHFDYRDPSEADLRWQVYTSLAYGSRGIIYFTYWNVKGLSRADAPSIMAMDGTRDKKYEYVRGINKRIAKLGPVLVRLISTGVYHTAPLPPGGRGLADDAPIKKAEGGAMTLGCFKSQDGKQYVMVVNRSFHNKMIARLTMDERIASASEISQSTGKLLTATTTTKKALAVALEPGDGRLFLLNRKQ